MNNPHFSTVLASIKMCIDQGVIDLSQEDYDFLTQDKLWIMTERSRVRRVIEATVYGALDMVGLPRFSAPAEYIAGVIIANVHPVNYLSACSVMEGAEFTENIINDVDAPLTAAQIFALVCQAASGETSRIEKLFEFHQKQKVIANV